MVRRPPRATLFPSTTLCRSAGHAVPVLPLVEEPAGFLAAEQIHGEAQAALLRPCIAALAQQRAEDRKSTRLNSSHANISYAVFCLKIKRVAFEAVARRTA